MSAHRGAVGTTIVGLVLLLVSACGPGRGTTVGASAPPAGALQAVSFGSATFAVPAAWPVYDLSAVSRRCARFDVHAVYRGHQSADATCPARALGKTEAVQVEANDPYAQARVLPAPPGANANSDAKANGLAVTYEPGSEATHSIVATFPSLGVVMRVTYGGDRALAQQIVASVKKGGG